MLNNVICMIRYGINKKYFEIAISFCNLEQGTSRVGNSNENKNIALNFYTHDIPCSFERR